MGKGIQITNTVILGLIAIPLTLFTITVLLAFWLNVIWIVLAIILFLGLMVYVSTSKPTTFSGSFDVIDKANNFSDMVEPVLAIIYFISFIVFMIGYFKNKKRSQSFSHP